MFSYHEKTHPARRCQHKPATAESKVSGETIHGFPIEPPDQRDEQGDHVQVVVEIDDRIVRVDVARGNPEYDARDAVVRKMEGTGVRATAAAHGDLVGNAFGPRDIDGERRQAGIRNCGRIKQTDLHAAAEAALTIGAR